MDDAETDDEQLEDEVVVEVVQPVLLVGGATGRGVGDVRRLVEHAEVEVGERALAQLLDGGRLATVNANHIAELK